MLESVADYALSKKFREKFKNQSMKISKVARSRFKEYSNNEGELGELLLFCFLEGHLGAPKILTKLEHKTTSDMYVNGSDGIHLLKLDNIHYQLIFGESKMYKTEQDGLREAFNSIYDLNNELLQKL
ncbi:HamA C-terminal domain-containing protein [Facklamia sp. P12955]|uniref:HamA C-terminal domain-containing protein n=1 Tax=Facklamia sp. P12955 TaxID=3421946 RepID=UPI003D17D908